MNVGRIDAHAISKKLQKIFILRVFKHSIYAHSRKEEMAEKGVLLSHKNIMVIIEYSVEG